MTLSLPSDYTDLEAIKDGNASWRIFDLEGQLMDAGAFTDPTQQIDVSGLAAGTYYIEIIQGKSKQNLKFVRFD